MIGYRCNRLTYIIEVDLSQVSQARYDYLPMYSQAWQVWLMDHIYIYIYNQLSYMYIYICICPVDYKPPVILVGL